MSFVVEDGTGLATANSYVSVLEADAYHLDRGNAAWTGTDGVKQAALIRATKALDGSRQVRGGEWPGIRANSAQALAWPRYSAVDVEDYDIDESSVPQAVKDAVCEGALLELAEPGALSPSLERGGQLIEKTVGSITKKWAAGASAVTVYSTIRQALSRIVIQSNGIKFRRG